MCEPVVIGTLTAAAGGMQAIGAHQAQSAAVARSNAIAQQQYTRELQIAAQRDRGKLNVYSAQLKADTAAKNAFYAGKSARQAEANRAVAASQQKRLQRKTEMAFAGQTNIQKAIQDQGTLLAQGKTGQSHLLQVMDVERAFGFEQAQIAATLEDQARATGVEMEGILLDQHSANIEAWNGLPASPLAPEASLLPIKPIKASGPSTLSLMGNLAGAAVSGVSAGYGMKADLKTING